MLTINEKEEEAKHLRTLGHYLEKFHNSTGYSNKDVADILKLDRSYYNKIRLKKYSPLTASIINIKKFASLTNENIFNFLYQIEEIPSETKEKDNQWIDILKKTFLESGPILRRALIHKRIKNILNKDDKISKEKTTKIFTLTALLIDISESEDWLSIIYQFVLKIHEQMNLEKESDLKELIRFIEIIKNKK
ncbi:hypothetical protein [Fluviispira vulneris]|uniref:hypothetical protein n=1 Tax=Fluviispira vulneris TaxID=2763012 RepID=UPI001644FE77|nr:hypothetical protein [Fluviispira vulneris]